MVAPKPLCGFLWNCQIGMRKQRVTYKVFLLMHIVHNNRAPSYPVDSITVIMSPDSERPPLATDRTAYRVQVMSTDAPSSYWTSSILSASADMISRPRLRSTSSQRYERQHYGV